jgi:hypothetical protein
VDLTPEAVKPADGESLMEALERVRKEARARGGVIPLELMTARQVDMFDQSSGAWKQTHKGVWFLPSQANTYVLWPYGDLFRVLSYANRGPKRTIVVAPESPMADAMLIAEREAVADDGAAAFSVASRNAPWRRRKASEKSVQFARTLGATVTDDMKGGEVSDAIAVKLASTYIDPKLIKKEASE